MNKKLESKRMFSIIMHAMIGIELLTMPINAVKYASNDGWIAPLVAGAIMFTNVQIGYWVCNKYPGLNFAQINEALYGKVLGKVFISVNIIYNVYACGIVLRLFSESISLFLLESTPIIIIMITFLIVVYYCAIMDFESLSIVFDILLPFILFTIVLLWLVSLTAITPYNLFPPFHGGVKPIIISALRTINPSAASFIFAFILPRFSDPQGTRKYTNLAIIISNLLYSAIICLCIMVFGATEINHMVFPTLILSKAIQLENQVFERTESLFMAAWIPITLTTFIIYFLISTISTEALFHTNRDKLVKLLHLPFIFIIAMLPQNKVQLFKMLDWANYGILSLAFGYLPVIALTVLFKKGRGKNGDSS